MLDYKDCIYHYKASTIRAIEESYQTGCLMLGRKGIEYEVASPFSFTEYRCDFERAIEYVKKHGLFREHWNYMEGRRKLTYKTVVEICKYLNGEKK